MRTDRQPELFEELHDEFQAADIRFKPSIERLWYGGMRPSVARMLSLRELLSSVEVRWGARAGQDLGEYIMRYMTGQPEPSSPNLNIQQMASAMIGLEVMGFPRYLREGFPPDDNTTILRRLRDESSDIHTLLYLKMYEHMALTSTDERVWRPAMMIMSDLSTLGGEPMRQEIAALCLERVMMQEGQRCGMLSPPEIPGRESDAGALYPRDGSSGIIPANDKSIAPVNGEGRAGRLAHREKFDFARSCIAESMFLVDPRVQMLNINALAIGQYREAIGPLLALCMGIRLRNGDPDLTPTGYEQSQLRSLLLSHLSLAYPLAGGDSSTLPAIGNHLQRTALLLMDPSRTIPDFSLGGELSLPALALANRELSKLLDPKGHLHPHPSYFYERENGYLTPRFPHGGLQQSAIVSTAELALNGFRPAASSLLQAMLELTGRFIPLSLTKEKPPRQIRESLGMMEMCIESLALAGIPGAKYIPPLFMRGDVRVSQLEEAQIAELAIPSLEMVRIQSAIAGNIGAALPLLLATRVVEADIEIRAIGSGARAPELFRDLMRRRNEAFGDKWDSFELPDTSLLAPFLRKMDERSCDRKRNSPPLSAREPVFLLTKRKER